MKTMHTI